MKHLFRLFVASNSMSLGNYFLQGYLPTDRFMLMNNIFFTMIVVCWIIHFTDKTIESFKSKQILKGILYVVGIVIPFGSMPIMFLTMPLLGPLSLTIILNTLICEGEIGFVFLLGR
ncbi:hypothetical protein [Terrisporobacter mayombei]|uniref:EamA domain-containing protein n=1 Tax=Terrisporobacter mayombei TaxID=1541 RepID=A0ABY9Q5Y4_9FIRM|nr:hypothetical protein [Terrisporobacter mayombei]MCC3868873.1 hypothetical protein [Terrisporobacter mayombei]WMT82994.1 hypothetical protein TEMA_34920 [Terrisporobacter mayombei]